ncbi:ferredoxin reductase [Longimycelium tulufanense]|uniref:Ferredoxin reductase n=1 Tax=Longimycelium tulufanense TaxID=907463 RepID=A0A8J3CC02_9PSEU|nr:ferredoxin reductase [Longimycelium tulufanense]
MVGGGLAGLRAAERLRELGFDGRLTIFGSERHGPYHRPALSKGMLTGEEHPRDVSLPSYCELDAVWRLNSPVRHLDPRRRLLQLPGGETVRYDGLVIATGVEPRHLEGAPFQDPRVHMLRTLDNSITLQRNIAASRGPVVVIGGGFTGCEVACSMVDIGREVAIVGRSAPLLGNVLGKDLGGRLTDLHRHHGVRLALGVRILHWVPQRYGIALHLSDGQFILAAAVVVSVGSVPSVSWLRGSDLVLEDGVLCEATCHVVGATDVVAAGDVARWPNLRFDNTPRRVEHWLNAVEMGRHAAESLLAGSRDARPFTPMPRFWSEQHGVRIMAAGMPKLGTDTIPLTAPDRGDRVVTGYVREGRLIGIVGLDNPRAVLAWTDELERQTQPRTIPTRNRYLRTPDEGSRSQPRMSAGEREKTQFLLKTQLRTRV